MCRFAEISKTELAGNCNSRVVRAFEYAEAECLVVNCKSLTPRSGFATDCCFMPWHENVYVCGLEASSFLSMTLRMLLNVEKLGRGLLTLVSNRKQ